MPFMNEVIREAMKERWSRQSAGTFHFPTREAQHAELLSLLAATGKPKGTFKRGMFVSYINNSGPLTPQARDGLALMFWRCLDMQKPADRKRIENTEEAELGQLPDVDCLLLMYDGNNFRFDVSSTELLRPC